MLFQIASGFLWVERDARDLSMHKRMHIVNDSSGASLESLLPSTLLVENSPSHIAHAHWRSERPWPRAIFPVVMPRA